MATPRSQRIGIWIIAIVMVVGTIGSFAVMILSNNNQVADQARINELSGQYQKAMKEYQTKSDAQALKLSGKYYAQFKIYSKLPAAFNKDKVSKLVKKDLKIGSGKVLTEKSTFSAYYIGWNPKGEIFDSSINDGKLKIPVQVKPGSVIPGLNEGAKGMKIGGVRELTIPADKAYGSQGSGDKIPANTPLKFVIMVIPLQKQIPQPELPSELLKYYNLS